MLAPGGFDSTADQWLTASAWKEINALDKLSSEFQLIVYDLGFAAEIVEQLMF